MFEGAGAAIVRSHFPTLPPSPAVVVAGAAAPRQGAQALARRAADIVAVIADRGLRRTGITCLCRARHGRQADAGYSVGLLLDSFTPILAQRDN